MQYRGASALFTLGRMTHRVLHISHTPTPVVLDTVPLGYKAHTRVLPEASLPLSRGSPTIQGSISTVYIGSMTDCVLHITHTLKSISAVIVSILAATRAISRLMKKIEENGDPDL